MSTKAKVITRSIWLISWVSLFTDMASEMLYPIMPFFFGQIGFSVLLIGVLEGLAEVVAGLSKPYFGRWSDICQKRLPFVRFGYTLSAISKPMMALFSYPLWIFFARATDRLGKGIRTGARDALLIDLSVIGTRGTVFGFHRAMDTAGAVLGPLIALILLYFYPQNYVRIFLIAFIPGLLSIFFTLVLKESPSGEMASILQTRISPLFFMKFWKQSPEQYRVLLKGLLLFAAFNSSDIFLLYKMKENGLTNSAVVAVYIFYNLVYALLAYPIGILADRVGLKKVFLMGLASFAAVYLGFAFFSNINIFLCLFILYGFYAAATEGVAKAWISSIVNPKDTATAIGTYTGFQSLAALVASSVTGILWYYTGPSITLSLTSCITLLVIIYLWRFKFD